MATTSQHPLAGDGVSKELLAKVCQKAWSDHVPPIGPLEEWDDRSWGDMIVPTEMPVLSIKEYKGTFDRVSLALERGEVFASPNKEEWKVLDYYGKPWTLQHVKDGTTIRTIEQALIAEWATKANGPHPNPYIAVVSVQYSRRGWGADYGVRRNGEIVLFAD